MMEETDIFKAVASNVTSAVKIEHDLDFTCSYSKQDIVDAFKVCSDILLNLQVIQGTPSDTITSVNAKLLGKKMSDSIMHILKDYLIYEEDSLFLPDEEIVRSDGDDNEETQESTDWSSSEGSEYEPEYLKDCQNRNYVPLKTKKKILQMVDAHPSWSLRTIQRHGGSALKRKDFLKRWRKDVETGCGLKEKYETINKWTLERFRQARKERQSVTTRMVQLWASQAAVQLNLEFKASKSWAARFKKFNRIKQKTIKQCVESTSALNIDKSLEEITESNNCN